MARRTTAGRSKHDSRPARESLRKRLGLRIARAIDARDGGCCVYCGATAEESGSHLHLDHVVPRSLGGEDSPSNLVTACRGCNCARKAMSLAQWSRYVAALRGLHPRTISRRVRARLAQPLPLAA
jgi:5-methylcytosine-specific restriction endonuclease McrA